MRIVGYALAALVVVTMTALAAVLPDQWRLSDRVGLVAIGAVGAGVLHLLARPRLEATETRVTVVNSIRTHVLEWPEIIDARMPTGEPWPTVDLADGSTLGVMGIQSNDGARAREALEDFQRLLHTRGEAQEPGPEPR
ncbi:PH domain-containing protein [Streptomonospora wellingtoniae]|uniref:PH domain-containing protein n=1 Tax=Streptomonospora wellingtoniae TaxID=3075544 RepID=A0ABU2KPD0_9ACTN|nr:PH domain-containing protein [Streptomonospora sp. DSM 45055]MDT0301122.1 PH domain-containing protein [Streptomonospora sp. DSM 45055]